MLILYNNNSEAFFDNLPGAKSAGPFNHLLRFASVHLRVAFDDKDPLFCNISSPNIIVVFTATFDELKQRSFLWDKMLKFDAYEYENPSWEAMFDPATPARAGPVPWPYIPWVSKVIPK